MNEPNSSQEFKLLDYWQILVRRRWLVYTSALICLVAAAVASFLATPLYRSSCTLAIERSGVRILRQDLSSAEPSWLDYQNFYNTQYKIIGSDAVLKLAVDRLDLAHRWPQGVTGSASEGPSTSGAASTAPEGTDRGAVDEDEEESPRPAPRPQDPRRPWIKKLRAALSVNPVRDSHLVELGFVSPDREFAAEAANAIAHAYITFTLSEKLDVAKQSGEFFVGRIAQLKQEIETDEHSLQDYMRRHRIVTGDANEIALQDLADLRTRATSAVADASAKRARYEVLSHSPAAALEDVRQNKLTEELARNLAEQDREYQQKLTVYGSAYPEVQQLKAKLDRSVAKLAAERERLAREMIQSVRADFDQAQRQADALRQLLAAAERRVGQLQIDSVDYQSLKAGIDRKRATYQELLERQSQVDLVAGFQDTGHNVRIVDEAVPAEDVFRPRKTLNTLQGLLLGLFAGLGLAVLSEYIDNTIKTPDDVRATLDLPVMGMIPARDQAEPDPSAAGGPPTADVGLGPFGEAFRELRTAVLLAKPANPPRALLLTSCVPGEGKTTTTIYLALALAQLGRRVLVVDTDLRRPRCHTLLGVTATRGVSTFLSGMDVLDDVIQATRLPLVSLLPSGPIPPNPAELLDSDRFRQLMAILAARRDFDHVLYDSPPVLAVVDPLLVGRHAEGTLLVMRSNFTPRDSARLGRQKLAAGLVNVLGVVLNAVQSEHVPYHYRAQRYDYSARHKAGADSVPAAPTVVHAAAAPGDPADVVSDVVLERDSPLKRRGRRSVS